MVTCLRMLLRHRSLPVASLHQVLRSLGHLGRSNHIATLLASLDRLLLPVNVTLANAALRACCRTGDVAAALSVFHNVWDRGVSPDEASFDAVLLVTAGQDAQACVGVCRQLYPLIWAQRA